MVLSKTSPDRAASRSQRTLVGFANAGVSFAGLTVDKLTDHLTLCVAVGLLVGKFVGVFGTAFLTIKLSFADVPMGPASVSCSPSRSCAASGSR